MKGLWIKQEFQLSTYRLSRTHMECKTMAFGIAGENCSWSSPNRDLKFQSLEISDQCSENGSNCWAGIENKIWPNSKEKEIQHFVNPMGQWFFSQLKKEICGKGKNENKSCSLSPTEQFLLKDLCVCQDNTCLVCWPSFGCQWWGVCRSWSWLFTEGVFQSWGRLRTVALTFDDQASGTP